MLVDLHVKIERVYIYRKSKVCGAALLHCMGGVFDPRTFSTRCVFLFQVRFGGAVNKPMEMTVEYIKANFKEITIPVTLVCAGNRRKEENMIKQGLGWVILFCSHCTC